MKPHKFLLWSARLGGLVVTAYLLVLYLSSAGDDLAGVRRELFPDIPFALLTVAGFALAWFKPFPGGIVLMGSSVLMAVFFICIDQLAMAVSYGLPTLLVGLCYVAAADKELI